MKTQTRKPNRFVHFFFISDRTCFNVQTYNNLTLGTCDSCASLCVSGCTGSQKIAGDGGCNKCDVITVDYYGNQVYNYKLSLCILELIFHIFLPQVTCLSSSSSCPETHYPDTSSSYTGLTSNGKLCRPCNEDCATCTGPGADNCMSCQTALVLDGAAIVQCLTSCPSSQNSSNCYYCHSQCNGCFGPSNTDCVSCVDKSLVNSNGQEVCVPSCQSDEYLADINGEYLCIPCHKECNGCTGPSNSDCIECKNYNNSFIAINECTPTCPFGSYGDSSSTCVACDPQCSGCTGPSSSNCTDCLEDTVSLSGGEDVCVPNCPVWQVYDINDESCVLSK